MTEKTTLRGRIALNSGASKGLGRRFALQLAGKGADLVLLARDARQLDEVAAQVREQGVACEAIVCDLGRANLGRDLEDQPAQAALASNLRHSDYARLVSGSLENLPAAFAKLDQKQYRQVSPLQRSNKDTKLIKRIKLLVAAERLQKNNTIIAQPTRPLGTSVTEF